jgi:hypothetical protein
MKELKALKISSADWAKSNRKIIVRKIIPTSSEASKRNVSAAVEQTIPNTRSLTSIVPIAESPVGESQTISTVEKQTLSSPVTTVEAPNSPNMSSSQTQTDIVFDNKQLTQAVLDLNNKLDSATHAQGVVNNAQPVQSGPMGIMQMIMDLANNYAPVVQKIFSGTGNEATTQMLEDIKNQLLYQKLGLLNPASPAKVTIS